MTRTSTSSSANSKERILADLSIELGKWLQQKRKKTRKLIRKNELRSKLKVLESKKL